MSQNNNKSPGRNAGDHISAEKFKIKEYIDIFKCPVCGDKMYLDGLKSIVCLKKHCFDLAKSGYVNLLLNAKKTKYDKGMFRARSAIGAMGFFAPLLETIVDFIANHISPLGTGPYKVLDAGCGEGFHLSRIIGDLQEKTGADFLGVGIDIAKEGIQMAAKNYGHMLWCVADLARIPFLDRQFGVILNILSPSNYNEFQRILHPGGLLIKVVPGSGYLKELRKIFYQETAKEAYSNERVVELFSRNFNLLRTEQVLYNVAVDKKGLEHIIKMTPLSWGASEAKVQQALAQGVDSVTVDLTVIAGNTHPA